MKSNKKTKECEIRKTITGVTLLNEAQVDASGYHKDEAGRLAWDIPGISMTDNQLTNWVVN